MLQKVRLFNMNEWKNTLYYPYQANEQGEIRNSITGRILKPIVSNGYNRVNLTTDGKRVTKYVHRLVWESFLALYQKVWR